MKTKLIIHHSGDSSPAPQFEKINGFHRGQGFPRSSLGLYGGYNWLIESDGQLKQYRGLEERGAHTDASCGEGHCNLVAMAVCLAGDFRSADPTPQQCATLYTLWKALNHPKLLLHSDVKGTECPGNFDYRNEILRRRLEDLRQRLYHAVRALPRFLGTPRGNMLSRLIERLRKMKGVS